MHECVSARVPACACSQWHACIQACVQTRMRARASPTQTRKRAPPYIGDARKVSRERWPAARQVCAHIYSCTRTCMHGQVLKHIACHACMCTGTHAHKGMHTHMRTCAAHGPGRCFVDFDSVAAGKKAVALSGSKIAGRPVRVTFSKSSDRGKVCIPSYKAPMYPPATSDL